MSSDLGNNRYKEPKETGRNILIVEDDSIQSFVLKAMVIEINYNVLGVAKTGKQAIRMAKKLKPDIILMDITLEDEMDGIAAAIEIKRSSNAHLIYVTGNSEAHLLNKVSQTQYVEYLEKPVYQELLKKALDKCFSKKI
ncbi:MAG: response regulator [Balneolaceae bacterium]